jgi:small ligand-binding sensory domain FIST|tara:strand:- start:110 stop:1303 length:1194 start_codon:yes stop_codon:yes gene_type:complete
MSVLPGHSVVKYFTLPFNEVEIENWAMAQKEALAGPVTFGQLFTTPECSRRAKEIMEIVQIYAHVPTIIGCSASGLIAGNQEIENEAGCCIALYHLPGTQARAIHLPLDVFEPADRAAKIRAAIGPHPEHVNAWTLFASSESIGNEAWLPDWDHATEHRTTIGGFACAASNAHESALYLNGAVHTDGAVALGLEGAVTIEPLISQGCRPVGSPWTITQAEDNVIHQIGNRPILEVLRDTLEGMSQKEQQKARGNIFIGLVLDEYQASFSVGDFLVRNLAAIDPQTGAVAIATPLRVGQNLQFQIRDAHSASNDFEMHLKEKAAELAGRSIYGSCLCDCIGRGTSLYGVPDHDVAIIHDTFSELPIVGLFCNGEFATSQNRTLLHGYAASLGLFVKKR